MGDSVESMVAAMAANGVSIWEIERVIARELKPAERRLWRETAPRDTRSKRHPEPVSDQEKTGTRQQGLGLSYSSFGETQLKLEGTWPACQRAMTDLERQHKHRAAARELGEIPWVGDPFKRWACGLSLLQFGLTYCMSEYDERGDVKLARMLKRPPSERMLGFINDLEQTILSGGNKHVRWPRGKGKSTWVKIAAMWALFYGYRKFVVVVAATKPMAEEATKEIWTRVAEDPLILRDFPEFAVPLRDVELTTQRMRSQTYRGVKTHVADNTRFAYKRFAILAGHPNTGGIIAARGADQAIRGLNIDSNRPDFIFIDDPQTDASAKSPKQCSDIEDRIQGALVGLGESTRRIAAVMASTPIEPDDVSERFADPERHPEWITTTERFVYRWGPETMVERYLAELRRDNLNKDARLTLSTEFYILNRDEIERGVEMMDPMDYDPTVEQSAYHHALNLLQTMKRKRFDSEMQMKPTRSQGIYHIDATLVSSRVNGFPMGTCPPQCNRGTIAFCDVNAVAGLRWGIMAFGDGRVTSMIAYGKYPERGRLFPEGTPEGAIPGILSAAIQRVTVSILNQTILNADGTPAHVQGICFDGGWQTQTVASTCERLNGYHGCPVAWSKGFNWRTYRPGRAKPELRGEYCHIGESENGMFLAFNSDYWRETAQTQFLNEPLSPSSCSFWGEDRLTHYDFASEVVAEQLTGKFVRPDNFTEWTWKKDGDNHYGDVLYGCLVFGSKRGMYDAVAAIVDAAVHGEEFERLKSGKIKRRRTEYVYEG